MPVYNRVSETNELLAEKAKDIPTVAQAAAAPTQAEFNALVDAFNALVAQLKDKSTKLK